MWSLHSNSDALQEIMCHLWCAEVDEETLAPKYYLNEGYEYEVILCFLLKYHGIETSSRTLKNRFKPLGLQRRKLLDSNDQVWELEYRRS